MACILLVTTTRLHVSQHVQMQWVTRHEAEGAEPPKGGKLAHFPLVIAMREPDTIPE